MILLQHHSTKCSDPDSFQLVTTSAKGRAVTLIGGKEALMFLSAPNGFKFAHHVQGKEGKSEVTNWKKNV